MKSETIQQTMRNWEQEPEKAKSKPTVNAVGDGAKAAMEAGSFRWEADLPAPLGGSNSAPSPTALLLSALAGCAVVFIRDTLAPQLDVAVDAVEATARCEADARGLLGMPGAVPDLRNIELDITVRSTESEAKVQKLYEAWRERCPIYLALIKPLQVTTRLQVSR